MNPTKWSDRRTVKVMLFMLVSAGFALGAATATHSWIWTGVFVLIDATGIAIGQTVIASRFSNESRR